MIIGWGRQVERNQAGVYIFFYTFLGSLPLLVIILWNFNNLGRFYFFFDYNLIINNFYYLFILIAFLIKFPIYSVHYWLLKAHVEAPVSGSIILAGVLLKLGGYGLIRFLILFENINFLLLEIILRLRILGGFYVRVNCLSHIDIKLLVASSSVVHMRMCISGIFLIKTLSFSGLIILMVGHGLCSSGLFYLVNLIYMRSGRRRMFLNKGILNIIPVLSLCIFLILIINISAPPCISLIGEIILILRLLNYDFFFFFLLSFLFHFLEQDTEFIYIL